ncbi:MAG: flavin reductase family protein [Pseudomonadota bacterium]
MPNSRDLRSAFSRFATGVTLVTASSPSGPIGITVNSFASVSLDPALVSFSLANDGGRTQSFLAAEHYAIHVLDASQLETCRAFVSSINAFATCDSTPNQHGVPVLHDALATFECRRHATYPGGDHTIVLAEIERYRWREGDALGFFGGQLTAFHRASNT